ncbi:DUF262 domain-containing protein [Hymenobacter sp. IS2118]|uniref:DUF262 domain-containing protein n=1 Tax=Hymenobacter sp. IS2118 TaxID=1505605 RepID=UPI00068A361F|nr:DUF262 domain-containing protein [Hymenobacter sp. IS2118]
MTANEIKLLGLLQGPRHFTIPIYQRPYSWNNEDCKKLFNDILQVGRDANRKSYFMGSVVYYQAAAHAIGTVPASLVIDGQQRLTTTILLLTAIYRLLKEQGEPVSGVSSEEIRALYLTNQFKTGEMSQRLLLTKRDKETLIAVVNTNPLPEHNSERVRENFEFFKEEVTSENVADLWTGISKLMVVGVSLEAGVDNPQLIFESLNSTGRPLDQADLIRNYVLMGQVPSVQVELYDKHWYPMEAAFGDAYSTMFGEFMRDFLTMKAGNLVSIWNVYQHFKNDYAAGRVGAEQVEGLVEELYHHATYYVRLRQPEKEEHTRLRAALERLISLGIGVAYPYLLSAYAASAAGLISKDGLVEVVEIIEAYLMRRAACGLPTNTLNSTFASFGNQLKGGDYLTSVKAHFLGMGWARRFPNDVEFRQQFIARDAYHFGKRHFLLSNLENYKRKEYVNIGDYTIEHIMPQNENVSEAWRAELGEGWEALHSKYLHTIGNLTLTGYNSEMSDRAFAEKKVLEGGFIDSPIKLNKSVATEPIWNEAAILKRANILADWAITIWPVPQVAEPVVVVEEEVDEEAEEAALVEAGLLEPAPTDEQE